MFAKNLCELFELEVLHYIRYLFKHSEDMALNILTNYGMLLLNWKEVFCLIQQHNNDYLPNILKKNVFPPKDGSG